MAKLNQLIAVANGKKSQTESALTELYHKIQKPALFEGIARVYRPKHEDGDQLPPESKHMQYRVSDALAAAATTLTDLFDAVATQDAANCEAKADVKVGEKTLLTEVPVTHLLFLEKQLTNVHTLVSKMPTLDPAEKWHKSDEVDGFATEPHDTARTRKVLRNHVKAEATKEHPAQVETYTEDEIVGFWSTTKFSGAIAESEKNETLTRVRALQEAVKTAREQANGIEVKQQREGAAIFEYLFGIGTQA